MVLTTGIYFLTVLEVKHSRLGAGHGGSRLSSQRFGRPRRADHLRSGVQPGQHGETLSQLKIQKLAVHGEVGTCSPSYSGDWGRRIAWTQEVEVAVSRDCAIALQPGWREWNFISKQNKIFKTLLLIVLIPSEGHLLPLSTYYHPSVSVSKFLLTRTPVILD